MERQPTFHWSLIKSHLVNINTFRSYSMQITRSLKLNKTISNKNVSSIIGIVFKVQLYRHRRIKEGYHRLFAPDGTQLFGSCRQGTLWKYQRLAPNVGHHYNILDVGFFDVQYVQQNFAKTAKLLLLLVFISSFSRGHLQRVPYNHELNSCVQSETERCVISVNLNSIFSD